MSMRTLRWFTILLPPTLIGGFEYFRHSFLLHALSMSAGNGVITLLTLVLSYCFATWMFRRIRAMNERLAQEQAARAVLEERERLAAELHDNIAQILFFLNVQLKKGQLDEARAAVTEIDHHLRQVIFNLRTPPTDGANFEARLTAWLEEWGGISGVAVESDLKLSSAPLPPAAEVALLSMIREAFTNIRKHSRADHAWIGLALTDGVWRLRVADNGVGLREDASQAASRYGLSMMRRRAAELGAELTIGEAPEGGVELRASGPLKEERKA